jgi:hypothetical protein
MNLKILTCVGGAVEVPDPSLVSVDRLDGGCLIVTPPRNVWERSELLADELARWSSLVAAAGRAMLDVLPQLDGGCINYWEAANWPLNDQAEPRGPKIPRGSRRVQLHLFGRARMASHPSWKWGEAPQFPMFVDRFNWARGNRRLSADECRNITAAIRGRLTLSYGFSIDEISNSAECTVCGYPVPSLPNELATRCAECHRRSQPGYSALDGREQQVRSNRQ